MKTDACKKGTSGWSISSGQRWSLTTAFAANSQSKNEAGFTSTFNDKKQLIEVKAVRNKDGIFMWDRFEHNNLGQKIKEISLDENGNPDGYSDYTFNDKGLNVDIKHFELPSGRLVYKQKRIYEYDIFGHWINQIFIREGTPI